MNWYKSGRPSLPDFSSRYTDELTGKKISFATIKTWYTKDTWVDRAEQLDKAARKKSDNAIVQQRVRMLKRQRSIGIKLQKKGMEFIDTQGLQNEFAAIRALEVGTQLERTSIGTPGMFEDITTMSDDQVLEAIQALLDAEQAEADSTGFEEGAQVIDVTPRNDV